MVRVFDSFVEDSPDVLVIGMVGEVITTIVEEFFVVFVVTRKMGRERVTERRQMKMNLL